MIDIEKHIASLPDPEKDAMPPPVGLTPEGRLQAQKDRQFEQSLLNTKTHTEQYAKRILEGPLFMGRFVKDGDWVTLAGGKRVWQKKIADLTGSVPFLSRPNAHCYVEVKGVSPKRPFAFTRLDKRNHPRQPSQHEKLTMEMDRGNLVWLFIGWWDSPDLPMQVKRGSNFVSKWYKRQVELTATLIQWENWLKIYDSHKYRSIRQKDRHLLDSCRITKVGNRWTLDEEHWWHGYI